MRVVKLNERDIENIIKKILKENDNTTIMNVSDLDTSNWSSEYHLNVRKGRKPYVKKGGIMSEVPKTKMNGQGKYFWLTDEQVVKLNDLSITMNKMISDYDDILNN